MTRQELAAFVYESQAVLADIERELRDDSTPFSELYLAYAEMGGAGVVAARRLDSARVALNQVGHLLEDFGIGESHRNSKGEPCFGTDVDGTVSGVCRKCNRVLRASHKAEET